VVCTGADDWRAHLKHLQVRGQPPHAAPAVNCSTLAQRDGRPRRAWLACRQERVVKLCQEVATSFADEVDFGRMEAGAKK
jgi:hypothetical protein